VAHRRPCGCTPRELEVLAAFRDGGEKGAAAQLGISINTVRAHLKNARSGHHGATTFQVGLAHAHELTLPNGLAGNSE
jgi:hypothetical protein